MQREYSIFLSNMLYLHTFLGLMYAKIICSACVKSSRWGVALITYTLSTPITDTWQHACKCKWSLGWHIGKPGVVKQAGWETSPIICLSYKQVVCRRLHYNFPSRSPLSVISIHTHARPVLMQSDCTDRDKEVALRSEMLSSQLHEWIILVGHWGCTSRQLRVHLCILYLINKREPLMLLLWEVTQLNQSCRQCQMEQSRPKTYR